MMPLISLIADPRTIVNDGDKVRLSDEQARAILALTLSRLTGLGRDDIAKAANEIAEEIKELLSILGSRDRILEIIRGELTAVKEAFGVPRRTAFSESEGDIDDEALIPREEAVLFKQERVGLPLAAAAAVVPASEKSEDRSLGS